MVYDVYVVLSIGLRNEEVSLMPCVQKQTVLKLDIKSNLETFLEVN